MMGLKAIQIKLPEIKEISKPESENYKEIKPKNGMTAEMAKTVWDNIFKEFKKNRDIIICMMNG